MRHASRGHTLLLCLTASAHLSLCQSYPTPQPTSPLPTLRRCRAKEHARMLQDELLARQRQQKTLARAQRHASIVGERERARARAHLRLIIYCLLRLVITRYAYLCVSASLCLCVSRTRVRTRARSLSLSLSPPHPSPPLPVPVPVPSSLPPLYPLSPSLPSSLTPSLSSSLTPSSLHAEVQRVCPTGARQRVHLEKRHAVQSCRQQRQTLAQVGLAISVSGYVSESLQ